MYIVLLQGNPLEEDTRVGAMISKVHAERVLGYIELAREEVKTVLLICMVETAVLRGIRSCVKLLYVLPICDNS